MDLPLFHLWIEDMTEESLPDEENSQFSSRGSEFIMQEHVSDILDRDFWRFSYFSYILLIFLVTKSLLFEVSLHNLNSSWLFIQNHMCKGFHHSFWNIFRIILFCLSLEFLFIKLIEDIIGIFLWNGLYRVLIVDIWILEVFVERFCRKLSKIAL